LIHAETVFEVGLEEAPDGFAHVHAFTLPGCVATGPTREEALDAFPRELSAWLRFLAGLGHAVPPDGRELEIVVEEWVATDANVAAGESTVCFDADRLRLGDTESLAGVRLLGDLRGRLLPRIRRARDEDLEGIGARPLTVRTILDELARAQWWTLTRLGASPLAEVPATVVGRLDTAMALVVQEMAHLPEETRARELRIDGEEWTPRKVLRRLLWLEWALGEAALQLLERGGVPGGSSR
jgi:predicted RNase H-like HicB family nuclease